MFCLSAQVGKHEEKVLTIKVAEEHIKWLCWSAYEMQGSSEKGYQNFARPFNPQTAARQ